MGSLHQERPKFFFDPTSNDPFFLRSPTPNAPFSSYTKCPLFSYSSRHTITFIFECPLPTKRKKILMNIMCTFAWIVGAARDQNHNSFSPRGGKKVGHHWITHFLRWSLAQCVCIVRVQELAAIFKLHCVDSHNVELVQIYPCSLPSHGNKSLKTWLLVI